MLALWASNQYLAASLRSCAPRGRPQFVVAYGLATKMKKCRSYKHLIKGKKNPKLKEKMISYRFALRYLMVSIIIDKKQPYRIALHCDIYNPIRYGKTISYRIVSRYLNFLILIDIIISIKKNMRYDYRDKSSYVYGESILL